MDDNVLRVGIGGPVGSGKTALIEALVPLLIRSGRRPSVITNDIYTQEDAQHIRRTLEGILEPERVVGVETGACPHTAVRDDPTMNLAAGAEMLERFPDTDTLFYESGGDNLTLTFSPALVDIFLFVLDTAEGEKMPRKRGPGITDSDLLVINKIDIAKYVRTDIGIMESDAHRVRENRPVVLTDCLTGVGVDDVLGYIESRRKVLI
ncbi:urease accessory protein UreG [Streptomyces sp. NPDC053741]|jgi:urease accessory protein|uniref:Urease accessory protein UreG n=2 Tax=Streptomyces TaxID=1883 RepID=A0A652KPB6_9ACTN|nr:MULTISPECIES: urease accessory protein UreG [Streptomyces]RAS37032.1 urease accessory protein [Streptomyces avidinii]TPN20268.1 urease accessory protein UreG [Mesorhizobium sp. B2-3-3]WSS61221.1 urease accessory protein UreG [Streptomyces sp. NBC_01177]WSS68267.1 urease accessory protein UreG [Streptomyces sp. NBC_01175]WSS75265.1 urease accessory protein UreG [Streptomyces sp. NBC_01174]SNX73512.1 urease accessory protein [Streptomyces microflavus]